MQPWFIWNGVDSRTMGLWVTELPAPTRAAERVQEVQIPGRSGTLTLREGTDVHEGYVKECVVTVPSTMFFEDRFNWLKGSGEVVFSNEPDRVYFANISAEVKFDKISNSLKQATIPFYVQPHKGQYPAETDIALYASGSVYNPGSVASKPIFVMTFTGSCEVAVGDAEMTFTHTGSSSQETITVDCDAELVTNTSGIWGGDVTGAFFRIAPGVSTVTLTDCTAVIKPRWRWC